jgi:hypothetical protein
MQDRQAFRGVLASYQVQNALYTYALRRSPESTASTNLALQPSENGVLAA